VPPEQRTPLVESLLRVIAQQEAEIERLRAEIARWKKLPPRPTIRPSTLGAPHPDPSHKKRRRGKRPGSAKRQKTGELVIHETIPLAIEGLREGTRQNGHEDFVVQDLRTEGHEEFHAEKDALLPAAREVSGYFQADDTGARHLGQNPCTTVIANPFFASFTATESKSRINFLKLLRVPHEEYVLGEDALLYLRDRISGLHPILSLPDLVRQAAQEA